MPKFYSELQEASLETLSTDPSRTSTGRIWNNSTENRIKTDDGSTKRALLRNDTKCVIGNSGTTANNIRFHRGGNALLQFVLASDATAEGSTSNSLAQISVRAANYTSGTRPTAANAGRLIWETDTSLVKVDNGAGWQTVGPSPTTTKGDLIANNGTLDVRLPVGTDGQVLQSDSTQTAGMAWKSSSNSPLVVQTKTANYTVVTTDDLILCSTNSFTLTLYTPVSNAGRRIKVMKTDSDFTKIITIAATGLTSTFLNTLNESWEFVSDGTNWIPMNHAIPSDWTNTYTPTIANFGTATAIEFRWKREGGDILVQGDFVSGTLAAGTPSVTLPSGLSMDTAQLLTAKRGIMGNVIGRINAAANALPSSTRGPFFMVYKSGSPTLLIMCATVNLGADASGTFFVEENATTIFATNSTGVTLFFRAPISGWNG